MELRSFKRFILKALLLIVGMSVLQSCALFVKKCPLPTCEIRKTHRHLLIFKKPQSKLSQKRNAKAKNDSIKRVQKQLEQDSIARLEHANDTTFKPHPTYVEVDGLVLDEEGNPYINPKQAKKQARAKRKAERKKAKAERKKAKKAAKGKLTEDEILAPIDETETNTYEGLTEEEYKQQRLKESRGDTLQTVSYSEKQIAKEVKKQAKADKKRERKEQRERRRGKKGESDFTKLYRSRVTKWWRRDQNPKTGKYFKRKKDSIFK